MKKKQERLAYKGINPANSDFSDRGGQTAEYKADCRTNANVHVGLHIQNSNLNIAALN